MAKRSGSARIEVRGLAELQKALRAADAALPRELRKVNKEAAELVATRARSRGSGLGGVAAKAADSIRATAEQRRAKIALGSNAYPFAFGANFGARHDELRRSGSRAVRGWNQFKENVGHPDAFLYWAISHERDRFLDTYTHMLSQLAKRIEGR